MIHWITIIQPLYNYKHVLNPTKYVSGKELLFTGTENRSATGYAQILADARIVPAVDQTAIAARQKDQIAGSGRAAAREAEIG